MNTSILAVSLLVLGAYCCVDVKTRQGFFLRSGDDINCSYILNSKVVHSLDEVRGYGHLRVSCADCAYSIVSNFGDCDDCLICTHNEGMQKCRSVVVPIIISVVIMLCIFAPLTFLLLLLESLLISGKKKQRRERRIQKIDSIIQSRLALPGNGEQIEMTQTPPPVPPRRNPYDIAQSALVAMAIANTIGQTAACDNLLFMSATGGLFQDQAYTKVATGLGIFHVGSTMCWKYPNGTQESVTLNEISNIRVYAPIYEACSFELDVKSHSECLGVYPCWEAINCNMESKYSKVGPKAYKLPSGRESCEIFPNLSQKSCFYKQLCVWYYWDVVPILDLCDLILQEISSHSIMRFEYHTLSGDTLPFTISDIDPFIQGPLFAHLVSSEISPVHPPTRYIRNHKGKFYFTDASPPSIGSCGQIGDYQKALQGNSSFFPDWDVKCRQDGGSVGCYTATPGYIRSLNMDLEREVEVRTSGFSYNVISKARGFLSLMIRLSEKPAQVVRAASCSIRILQTYGCTGCTEHPFIVLSASDITATGALQFSSNCTFHMSEVFCSSQPQIIELRESPWGCWIRVAGTNQTLNVNFTYDFRGEIFSGGVITYRSQETFSEKLALGLSSPSFLTSLQVSLGIGFVTATAATIIKSTMKYLAYRAGRDENLA